MYKIQWTEDVVSLGLRYGKFKMCITKQIDKRFCLQY